MPESTQRRLCRQLPLTATSNASTASRTAVARHSTGLLLAVGSLLKDLHSTAALLLPWKAPLKYSNTLFFSSEGRIL